MDINTFSFNALQYKLISESTDINSMPVLSSEANLSLGTGKRTIFLGNGSFSGTSENERVHSYTLEMFFIKEDNDQNYDNGKTFSAHIEILEGESEDSNYLTDKIVNQYGIQNITKAPAGTFNNLSLSDENRMYKIDDDYGMSYYYRGAKAHINNNLIFANHQWKIVRINGNGSIKILYNGTCFDNSCDINDVGPDTQIDITPFNVEYTDNKYVGYMFGGSPGDASTSYEQAHSNDTNSTIKTKLENWYSLNILGTRYESYVHDTLFCNDRQLEEDIGGLVTGPGYGDVDTNYAVRYRLTDNKNPDLKCPRKIDRFTSDDTTIGNGDLTYPIGLITPDETSLAGLVFSEITDSNYLYTGEYYWTLGARSFSSNFAFGWGVHSTGDLNGNGVRQDFYGMRSVLNLKPDTKVIGAGTKKDPFIVI